MFPIQSIIANGGATINKKGDCVSLTGYQVSFQDLGTFPVKELTSEKISAVCAKLRQGDYCGIWIDEGLCYLDISRHVATKHEAIEIGEQLCQQSILRWKDMELIWL